MAYYQNKNRSSTNIVRKDLNVQVAKEKEIIREVKNAKEARRALELITDLRLKNSKKIQQKVVQSARQQKSKRVNSFAAPRHPCINRGSNVVEQMALSELFTGVSPDETKNLVKEFTAILPDVRTSFEDVGASARSIGIFMAEIKPKLDALLQNSELKGNLNQMSNGIFDASVDVANTAKSWDAEKVVPTAIAVFLAVLCAVKLAEGYDKRWALLLTAICCWLEYKYTILTDVVLDLKRACNSFYSPGPKAQASDSEFRNCISFALLSVLSVCSIGMKARKDQFIDFMKTASMFDSARKGTLEWVDQAVAFLQSAVNYIRNNMLGLKSVDIIARSHEDFHAWFEQVNEFLNDMNQGKIQVNRENADHLRMLQMRGRNMLVEKEKMVTPMIRNAVGATNNLINNAMKLFSQACLPGSGPRQEPVVVCFTGNTGVGKSGVLYPLSFDILRHVQIVKDSVSDNLNDYVYSRKIEHTYWDGYVGQPVCLYDDFGQLRSQPGDKDDEFMEMIRTGNLFPHVCHMAAMENKGTTIFQSKFVFLSTNWRDFNSGVTTINHAEAFRRRIDFSVEVNVKDAFLTKCEDGHPRIDPAKTNGAFDSDIYEFKVRDSRGVLTSMSYKELVWTIAHSYRTKSARAEMYAREVFDERFSKDDVGREKEFLARLAHPVEQMAGEASGSTINFCGDFPHIHEPTGVHGINSHVLPPKPLHQTFEPGPNDDEIGVEDLTTLEMLRNSNNHAGYDVGENRYVRSAMIFLAKYPGASLRLSAFRKWAYGIVQYSFHTPTLRLLGIFLCWVPKLMEDFFLSDRSEDDLQLMSDYIISYHHHDICVCLNEAYLPKVELVGMQKLWDRLKKYAKRLYIDMQIKIRDFLADPLVSVLTRFFVTWSIFFGALSALGALGSAFVSAITPSPKPFVEEIAPAVADYSVKAYDAVKKGCEKVEFSSAHEEDRSEYIYVECTTSEDEADGTRPKKAMKAQDASGERLRKGNKRVRRIKVVPKPGIQEQAADKNAMEVATKTLSKNLMSLSVFRVISGVPTRERVGFGIAIRGNLIIFPRHYIHRLRNSFKVDKFYFQSCTSGPICVETDWLIDPSLTNVLDHLDVAAINLEHTSSRFPFVPDIVGRFVDEAMFTKRRSCHVYLGILLSDVNAGKDVFHIFSAQAKAVNDVTVRSEMNDRDWIVSGGYCYHAPTQAGWCGAPLFIVDSTCGPAKILGFHVAGDVAAGYGYSTNISREIIELLTLDHTPMVAVAQALEYKDSFEYIGTVTDPVHEPKVSKIVPTPLKDSWMRAKKAPAVLAPVFLSGVTVDPKEKAISKYCGPIHKLPDEFFVAGDAYLAKIINEAHPSDLDDMRVVFDFNTAVAGMPGVQFFDGIPRNTSAGYPWCHQAKPPFNGKKKWFGLEGDYLLNETADEVREMTAAIIREARRGNRRRNVFVDTLKDELRPMEKVQIAKTRLISAGPVDYLVAVRQFFMGFTCSFMRGRIDNGSCIGVNPYGYDWHRMANMLRSKGPHCIDGDFSGLDTSLMPDGLEAIGRWIDQWYGGDLSDSKVREVLFQDVHKSVHLFGAILYMWTKSLPSGHGLTSIINTYYVHAAFRAVWIILGKPHGYTIVDFDKHVVLFVYNDDNIANISPEVIDWYNFQTILACFTKLHLVYTAASKKEVTYKSKPLSECTFLKRKFRYDDGVGRFVAPLDLDTILEIPFWSKQGALNYDIMIDNVRTCLEELSLHDKATFNEWQPKILDACRARIRHRPEIVDYHALQNMMLERDASY